MRRTSFVGEKADSKRENYVFLILIVFALENKRIVPLQTAKPPRVTLGTAFAFHIVEKLLT
jgi:hypothetical protein